MNRTPANLWFGGADAAGAHQYPAAVSPQGSLNVKHSSGGPCSRCRLSGSLRMAAEWACSNSLVAGTIWRCRPGTPSDWTPWTTPDRGPPRPDAAETGWRRHSESRAGGTIFIVPSTHFWSNSVVKQLAFAAWTIAFVALHYYPDWSLKTKRNKVKNLSKRMCKKNQSLWVLQRQAHHTELSREQPVINHLKQWKRDSCHFFIWRGHLFHPIFYVDTSIYKPFVDLLSGRKEKMTQ